MKYLLNKLASYEALVAHASLTQVLNKPGIDPVSKEIAIRRFIKELLSGTLINNELLQAESKKPGNELGHSFQADLKTKEVQAELGAMISRHNYGKILKYLNPDPNSIGRVVAKNKLTDMINEGLDNAHNMDVEKEIYQKLTGKSFKRKEFVAFTPMV